MGNVYLVSLSDFFLDFVALWSFHASCVIDSMYALMNFAATCGTMAFPQSLSQPTLLEIPEASGKIPGSTRHHSPPPLAFLLQQRSKSDQ